MWRLFLVLVVMTLPALPTGTLASELLSVDPSNCTIEPAEIVGPGDPGDLNVPTPTPSPIATAGASPADPSDAEAIRERIAQAIACTNAGDLPRMLANFTENWIETRFAAYDLVFLQRYFEVAASPTPLPESDRIELVAIQEVELRGDGVALATVITKQHDTESVSLVALIEEQGVWLIDSGEVSSIG